MLVPLVSADLGILVDLQPAELNRPDRAEILGVRRHDNQVVDRGISRDLDISLAPHLRQMMPPALAHAPDKRVGSTQQQHLGHQRMAAGQHGHILQHDRLEQRRHQLLAMDALLLKAVDVRLGEHAALACHRMNAQPLITEVRQTLGRNPQFGNDLVDDSPGPAGTLVVHRGQFLEPPGLRILLEDDDLGILAAQLDDAANLREQPLDRQADRVDLLDVPGADEARQVGPAAAGDEDRASSPAGRRQSATRCV